jgi:hypothetical protein
MRPGVKDILWKGIIEDLFADFLRFFYANADEVFDMARGFDFLDKELGQLYPGEDVRYPKFVDKLVKVYRKDGSEKWLLIHIEVQGYKDKFFTRRMFTYFYRILDRFNQEVASIAIFTDGDDNYQPGCYEYNSLETSNIFRFKTYKIKGQDVAALEHSNNPFAVVILTVLLALQRWERGEEERLGLSLDLAQRLLKKGFSWDKIGRLLSFLKTYVNFEHPELFVKFDNQIDVITNKKKVMGIYELIIKMRVDEGVEKGLEQGTEKAKYSFITNLLLKTDHSLKEIAELTDASIDYVIEIKNSLPAA